MTTIGCTSRECTPLREMLKFPAVKSCAAHTPPLFVPLMSALLALLALIPLVPEPPVATSAERDAAERSHDRANSLLLPPLCVGLVGCWLCAVPAYTVTVGLLAYTLFDACCLLVSPHAVKLRRVILAHHVVTLLFLLVPLHHPDLAEYTAIAGGAEVQTLALILRRRLRREAPRATVLASVVAVWHDVSFVLIRLVMHPLLLIGFWTRMDLPRIEALVVTACQSLLCLFNAVLLKRELEARSQAHR